MKNLLLITCLLIIISSPIMAKTAEEWIDKGLEYQKNQDYGKAIKMYENAIDEDYKCAEAYFRISYVKYLQGLTKEAFEYIDTCIKIDPKYSPGVMFKGLLFAMQRDFLQAINYADMALNLEPNEPIIWYMKGIILNEKQDYNNAIVCFDKALELDPNYEDAKKAKEQSNSFIEGINYRNSSKKSNSTKNTGDMVISQGPFLINWNTIKEGSYYYIVGYVKNNSNTQVKSVYIKFNIYDKNNMQIGDTIDGVNNLEPYGIWKFKTMILEKEASSVKFIEVTHYNL